MADKPSLLPTQHPSPLLWEHHLIFLWRPPLSHSFWIELPNSGLGQISRLYTSLKRVVEGSPKPRQIRSNPRALKLLEMGHPSLGSCQAGTAEAWSCWWPSSHFTGRSCLILTLSHGEESQTARRDRFPAASFRHLQPAGPSFDVFFP